MNRLTELKQKSPSFGLRKRRSNETKTRSRRVILLLLLLSTLFWAAGCEDYYSSSPGYYDPASYYAANPFDFLDHDRRYYRGPGYSVWPRVLCLGTRLLGISHRCSPPGAPVSPAATARYLTLVSSSGSMGVTSRKDTKPLHLARRRHVSRLPSRDQSTQQTEKRADECFPKNF